MKTFSSTLLILIFICQGSFAQLIEQNKNDLPRSYEFHIKKQKQNKTTAWIMAGSGIAFFIGGIAVNGTEVYANTFAEIFTLGLAEPEYENKGDWMYYVGGTLVATSIPFFISASNHKKKAGLSLKSASVTVQTVSIAKTTYPSLGLKVTF